jgi:hypothetical protein
MSDWLLIIIGVVLVAAIVVMIGGCTPVVGPNSFDPNQITVNIYVTIPPGAVVVEPNAITINAPVTFNISGSLLKDANYGQAR